MKENLQSDSSFLRHKGAYDTLFQTNKTDPFFHLLKRKHAHFYTGEEVGLVSF